MGNGHHIRGTEAFGYSTPKAFLFSFYFYMNAVKRICNKYPFANVTYLTGYVAHFCYIRLKSFDTFFKVVVEHKDYVTANCILRMLGDCVAVFHLIYMEQDADLRLLRHCLYVLEGCERNMDVLPEGGINQGCIPDDELQELEEQVRFNRAHREAMMNEVQAMLDSSPLKKKDEAAFNRIVKERNWKFKTFEDVRATKNQYQWKDMYARIGKCDTFDLFSYISQYAHGLSMSNLVINVNEHSFDGMLGEAVGLMDRMTSSIYLLYPEDYRFIIAGLLEPDMRDKLLACYDDTHRPSKEKWEQCVLAKINQATC